MNSADSSTPLDRPENEAPRDAIADAPPPRARRAIARIGVPVFAAAMLVCLGAYLVSAVPGAWFPQASPQIWNAQALALARGTGGIEDRELVVTQPDATGLALISLATDFRSSDYPAIAWAVSDLAERADVRLLWRSDYRPDKLNSISLRVDAGRTLPEVLSKNPNWIGRITGLALAIHDPLAQPARVAGVVAKPMGALEVLRDRASEWLAFEPWNGASINTITGGAVIQDVPLPLLVATIVAISAAVVLVASRWTPLVPRTALPALLAGFFVAGWLALDARWTLNLARQERATAHQYFGKDAHAKRLASEDGALFAFVDKALHTLPKTPARVFVAADADYFRGRAAYHLYPHDVYFSPRGNTLPPASAMRAGDWLLVFLRKGIQYDAAQGRIRWDGNETVSADARLVEPGAALFLIR